MDERDNKSFHSQSQELPVAPNSFEQRLARLGRSRWGQAAALVLGVPSVLTLAYQINQPPAEIRPQLVLAESDVNQQWLKYQSKEFQFDYPNGWQKNDKAQSVFLSNPQTNQQEVTVSVWREALWGQSLTEQAELKGQAYRARSQDSQTLPSTIHHRTIRDQQAVVLEYGTGDGGERYNVQLVLLQDNGSVLTMLVAIRLSQIKKYTPITEKIIGSLQPTTK